MKLPYQQLEELEDSLQAVRHTVTPKDSWERWLALPTTQLFMQEMEHAYLEVCVNEPVVKGHAVATGAEMVYCSNPVEETAINAAIRSGQMQALEAVISYRPINLEGNDDES